MTADECAMRCWERYWRECRWEKSEATKAVAELRHSSVEDEAIVDHVIYHFQRKKGLDFERVIKEEWGSFLRLSVVDAQVRTKRDDRVPFDVVLEFPKLYVAISCTTIPQERKNSAWSEEAEQLHHDRRALAGEKRYRYIGLFAMGVPAKKGSPPSLERTQKKRESLQDLIGQRGRIVAIQDTKDTAEVLRDLLRDGV